MKTLILAALVVMFAVPAVAGHPHPCASRQEALSWLVTRDGLSLKNVGNTNEGLPMETYADVETGRWAIIVTLPDGRSCLMESGVNYKGTTLPSNT